MTLILNYVDPDCIIQVSDRRLTKVTHQNGLWVPAPVEPEEGAFKSVIKDFIAVVGYCGLAQLPHSPGAIAAGRGPIEDIATSAWIAEVLEQATTLHDVGRLMATALAETFEALAKQGDARATFYSGMFGVTWVHYEDQRIRPAHWHIVHDGQTPGAVTGDWRYEDDSLIYSLTPSEPLEPDIEQRLRAQLEYCLATQAEPAAKTEVLREAVLESSRSPATEGRIGEAVIETCIPRGVAEAIYANERFWVDCGVPAKADRLSYRHVAADGTTTPGGPLFAGGGMLAHEGFTLDRPHWVQIDKSGGVTVCYDGTRPDGDAPKPDEPDYVAPIDE